MKVSTASVDDYYMPILRALAEGEWKRKRIIEKIRVMLDIDDEQMNVLTSPRQGEKIGKRIKVLSDYDNAIYNLKKIGFVVYVSGKSLLTNKGKDYIIKHDTLTSDDYKMLKGQL